MTDRPTADTITDDELDALYRELEHTHVRARTLVRRLTDVKGERDNARAAIGRARALASRWAVLRAYGSAATELRSALDEPSPGATEPPSIARELIAAAIYEHNNPGRPWAHAHPDDRITYGGDADAALAVIQPGTRITATLARMSEATVQRVTALHEQWVKAGPPPLGTSVSRWWDARLAELHDAILPPTT